MGNKTIAVRMVMGTPTNSSRTGDGELMTYWRYHPKSNACRKCQAQRGLWFTAYPGPVHPNCKCAIEKFKAKKVSGRSEQLIVPPGADIEANIAEARKVRRACEAVSGLGALTCKCAFLWNKFYPDHDWDYKVEKIGEGKKKYRPEFEDFGNYHFGIIANAIGIPYDVAQFGAGFVQATISRRTKRDWVFSRLYGDDPRDAAMIRKGYQYPFK